MTSKPRTALLALTAAATLAFALGGCASAAPAPASPSESASSAPADDVACAGVTVVIDTGDLEVTDDPSDEVCVETEETILGTDAIAAAGFTTEGTATYPEDVVCRVDGVPSAETELTGDDGAPYHEACANMPPAAAYWGLWVKPVGGVWDYAQTSLPTLQLNPGDSVQLLFTVNGEPAAPAS
ncbi:hypothetical protein [Microbacterium sp.]|uniref:hypothetical protein n=1 Tax=Microbacterium sp. TaxID=51671 RepID=UPI0039E54BCA